MADLKAAIREMLKNGMSPQQVKDNLKELGVENADEMFEAATESLKGMNLAAQSAKKTSNELTASTSKTQSSPKADSSGMSEMPLGGNNNEPAQPIIEKEVASKMAELEKVASQPMPGSAEEKLDDAIALLKALAEVNKKILETNREMLLRLKN